jgi:flagellar hook-associated protein 3 FlgL
MKATQGTTYRMLGSRLNNLTTQLEQLRKIGATGKRINKPSDDPAAIRPVLNTRKQLSNVDRYMETMGQTLDKMQATDGQLEHVENIMQRLKEISVNVVNGSLNNEDRSVLADEVVHLRQELLDAANSKVDGKYLFSGYEESTIPIVKNSSYDPLLYDPADHTTWPYTYQGDDNPTLLEITPGEKLQATLTGNDLFFGTSTWNATPPPNNAVEPGRYDLFAVLTQTEEAIRTNDPAALQTSIADIDGASEQNRRLRSQMGNRASRVETAMHHQEAVRIDLKQILSRYEDADAIEAFNNIVQQETAFQAALNVTGKVSQLSILDFI